MVRGSSRWQCRPLAVPPAVPGASRLCRHLRRRLLVAKLGSGVHAERAGPTAEAVTLGAVLAAVALLAEQDLLVLAAVGRVQRLVAHGCKRHVHMCQRLELDRRARLSTGVNKEGIWKVVF